MSRRVLVSGYYGRGNLGDEALLAGLLAGLRRAGAPEPLVLSADPGATRGLHGVAAASRTVGLPAAVLRTQALVSGGGGLLQDVTSSRSLRYYLAVVSLARALGRPVVVYGQSLGPLSTAGRRLVQRALAGVPLGLRDAPSRALARSLGLEPVAVGDAALLLAPPEPADADGEARDGARRVVLVPRGGYPTATTALAELAQRCLAAGLLVEAVPFHAGVDDAEAERLCAMAPGVVRRTARTPQQAMAAVSDTHLVVSARLHGLVLAAAAGTPHAGISYDPKVRGFAQETDAPCWDVPVDDRAARGVGRELWGLVARPPLDVARVAAAKAEAEAGVRWLVERLGASSRQ